MSVKPGKTSRTSSPTDGDVVQAAGVAQRVDVARGQRRRVAVAAHGPGGANGGPGALEVRQRADDVAGGGVLRAEVEVQEGVVDALGHLALEQLEVAVGLVLGVADRAQVAEVLDAHGGALLALGQVARQALGDLLVDAPLEAVLGAVAEQAHGVVGDRRAVLEIARVVDLGQEEGLAPGAARRARAGARTSSATSTSSASRYMTQSPVAASKDTLRAAEKSPSHS